MAEFEIRAYRRSDRERIRFIAFETGYMGEPVDWLWRDRESFADLITRYYTDKEQEYIIPPGMVIYVKTGDQVEAGQQLTEGNLDLQQLFRLRGKDAVQKYILKDVQHGYSSQGQKLNDKHIEIIIKQMFSRVQVADSGETELLPGEIVEKAQFIAENSRAKKGKYKPATADELFLGITKVSLSTTSFLSAASFQETARVLINAAITGKKDTLEGLKENVIIGRLIPAGTGFEKGKMDEIRDESCFAAEKK